MLEELIKESNISVTIDNSQIEVPEIKEMLIQITDNHYLAPCLSMAENTQLINAKNKGVWLEISFNEIKKYKDFEFEKLLINLFPKHDFLVMHRFVDDKYQGKSITINLAYKTTTLYKYIVECQKENNEKK